MVTRAIAPVMKARRELDAPVKTYLGHYSPYPGVKYYKLLTDVDLALGRGKIGPVGWRRGVLPVNDITPIEGEELVPA